MQKKLIALAVAGLVSGGAFAQQSNVTISGQFRVHWDNVSAGGATVAGADMTSRTRVTDNNSWIRFSGEEALGGGTSAWFQVESAIGTSDNIGTTGGIQAAGAAIANSATVGTRNTAVGLKGAWGNAFLGKWDVYYHTLAPIDGAGLADGLTMAASSLNLFFSNGQGNTYGGRFNDVIAYVTPNFNGLSATIGYTTSPSFEQTTPSMRAKDNGWTFNPTYVNGPLAVIYAYLNGKNIGASTAAAGGASGNNLTANRLGASWSFPMGLKVGVLWDKNKVEVADGTASLAAIGANPASGAIAAHSYRERTAWSLPITYKVAAHNFNFTYAKAGDTNTSVGTLRDSGAKMYMLAYRYDLSKRTNLNASWTAISNGQNGRYDFWHPSQAIGAASATGLSYGTDPRMFAVGMHHAF